MLLIIMCCLVVASAKFITYSDVSGSAYTVTYDARSFFINDARTILQAGELHYARSTPGTWNDLLGKARMQGLNAIQTYVFWNLHEHVQGHIDFSTPDLGLFLNLAAKNNLFIVLRIGPYCDAEWNYGCYPPWIGQIPGIVPRSYNQPWLTLMESFVNNTLAFVEPFLAKNGGPIIMSQIENEYFGNDYAYLGWIANLVHNNSALCPVWLMCQGQSANGTISTCDDCSCVEWAPGHIQNFPRQPLMNTEDHGFNQRWGWAPAYRTVEDLANGVAQWFAIGGTYHSYYMWHGGNNYGRSAASGIATEYANDVLLYSDGIPHEPKYSHLAILHFLLAEYSDVLTGQLPPPPEPLQVWNGSAWERGNVTLFSYGNLMTLGFVVSNLPSSSLVLVGNHTIAVPQDSVSLIAQNGSVLWNSAVYANNSQNFRISTIASNINWVYWGEPVGEAQPQVNGSVIPQITSLFPLEQLNITQDETIYMWYRTNITISGTSTSKVTFNGRKANAYMLFIGGALVDSVADYSHNGGVQPVTLVFNTTSMKGEFLLEILSVSLGIDSAGEIERKGIVSNVTFNGEQVKIWTHQKGMSGEYLEIYGKGVLSVPWKIPSTGAFGKPATWFMASVILPQDTAQFVDNPLFLNVTGLTRGHAYINGMDIGLYWTLPGLCDYAPPSYGCQQGLYLNTCGEPTQILYHIPPDWVTPGKNVITIFEDTGMMSLDTIQLVQKIVN